MNKIAIIGGGPGGYVAAIRAAQLGAEVTVFEFDKLGGTCLNRGCIPTKALLHTTELYHKLLEEANNGLIVENARIDSDKLHKRKKQVVRSLVSGVGVLMKKNNIRVVNERATLLEGKKVKFGDNVEDFDKVVLASGSEPINLPIPGFESKNVIDSTGALELEDTPKSMVIVGGGVIGVEMAQIYSSLGAEVTIVELAGNILPGVDLDVVNTMRSILEFNQIKVMTDSKLVKIEENDELFCTIQSADGDMIVQSEYVLMSVGRKPYYEGLGHENIVKNEDGVPVVDENFETSVDGVYAIGDLNKQIMLAHAASAQGIKAVEHAMGHVGHYNSKAVPACIYTSPEIASVGLTEEEAKEQGIEYKVSKYSLVGNGKSMIENNGVGFVKLISGAEFNDIIGAHIIGPRATDMIAELVLAINMELTAEEIASTIHPHPTVSEAIQEAAHGLLDGAIHAV